MIKVGRRVLDPLNREVEVTAVDGDWVTVRLAGPYAATVRYLRSMLRERPGEDSNLRPARI